MAEKMYWGVCNIPAFICGICSIRRLSFCWCGYSWKKDDKGTIRI